MMLLHCNLLLAALTLVALLTAVPTGNARFHRPSRQLAENTTTTPLELCKAELECNECVQEIAKWQAVCSCTEMSDGSVKQECAYECQQCWTDTDVCYFSNFTDTVLQTDDGSGYWGGYNENCVITENDEICVSTMDQNAPSPAPCSVSVNGMECKSCFDVLNANSTDFEMDCTNIELGAFMTLTDTGEVTGFVGIFENLGYYMGAFDHEEYPKCPAKPELLQDTDASPESVLWITATMGIVATALLV
jgi:hypothetical protein